MSRELKRQLITAYVSFGLVELATGILGYATHHLDAWSIILLCGSYAAFSTLWTWYSIHDERETRKRELEVQGDLGELGLNMVKGKAGTYGVAQEGPLSDVLVIEDLSIDELEAFRDGVQQGLMMGYMEVRESNTENHLAEREQQQHLEDRQHFGVGGEYIPDEDIPGRN